MSLFFRRKKKSKPVSPDSVPSAVSVPSAGSAPSAASPSRTPVPASASSDASATSGQSAPSAPSPTATQSVPAPSREELLDAAYRSWHAELTERAEQAHADMTTARRALIDLSQVHPTGSAQFYGHSATRLSSLIREEQAYRQASTQLSKLREEIRRAEETHGLAPITLTVGAITWTELPPAREEEPWSPSVDENGQVSAQPVEQAAMEASEDPGVPEDPAAPEEPADTKEKLEPGVGNDEGNQPENQPEEEIRQAVVVTESAIMRDVRMHFLEDNDAVVQLTERVDINPAIVRALRDHGASADDVAYLRDLAQRGVVEELMDMIRQLGVLYLPGFSYENRSLLGCFIQPEQLMLDDLEAMEPYIRTSGVMAALAGDAETIHLSASPLPPGSDEDRATEVERGAGDRDVQEQCAVEAVASGRSLVLDCPPGSQRMGTVASMVADAAASGRSVMYIPARASSGQALERELNDINLGDLVLDFSQVDAVPHRLRTGMRLEMPDLMNEETLHMRSELEQVRATLGQFMDDLHRVDEQWGVSVSELLEQLAKVTEDIDGPETRVRLSAATLADLQENGLDRARTKLREAGKLLAFDPKIINSAWANSTIIDMHAGNAALEEARRLADITIPAVIGQSSRAAGETGLVPAQTLKEWFEQIDVLDGVAESLDIFIPRIFESSVLDLVIATASKDWREAQGHQMTGGERRRLKKQAMDLVRPGAMPRDLHAELKLVQTRGEMWRSHSAEGGWPQVPDGMAQIRSTRSEIERDLTALSSRLRGEDFWAMPFDELQERLEALVADAGHMDLLPQRNAILDDLRASGFSAFLDDMLARAVRPHMVLAEFELAYTSSVFEQMIMRSPALSQLGARDLAELLDRLRELDVAHTKSLSGPVLRAVVNNARAVMFERREETIALDNSLDRLGVSGLRDAIAAHPRTVQTARPVWIVPPTAVAEYIPPMPWVDLVIAEIADGTSVASLVSPLMRGRQAVLVTDTRRAAIIGSPNCATAAFAQILPVCELPTNRAKHDPLALQALTTHGYEGVFTQIPALPGRKNSTLRVVDGRGVPSSTSDGTIESPKAEVDAVVDAVLTHAMERPDQSLGVVTIAPAHATRVRDALRQLRTSTQELAALDAGINGEPLTVVDISQASGLRRDHIILSVGYGKTVHGRVLHSFGQLATPAGLAGLIDALEAPREALTMISSLAPGEISTSRVSTPGPLLLAELLEQAGSEEWVSTENAESGEIAPLLVDLASRIENSGWRTSANYGFPGSERIPLVVGHDSIPGTWAVAVVYDDESYVAERSMRRRDRYRIAALEERGWVVHQTFSTSLFVDPQGQARAIVNLAKEVRDRATGEATVAVPKVDEWGNEAGRAVTIEDVRRQAQARGPRPDVTPGRSLATYSDAELGAVITWVTSDGVARDVEQIVATVRSELAIAQTAQNDRVLANVVRRVTGVNKNAEGAGAGNVAVADADTGSDTGTGAADSARNQDPAGDPDSASDPNSASDPGLEA
ncbi:MAG: hypothetical protein GX483_08825 [Actinomycetaceae bacterium]|nr:hypothetical protein [Actinomycetaceae bacterium]